MGESSDSSGGVKIPWGLIYRQNGEVCFPGELFYACPTERKTADLGEVGRDCFSAGLWKIMVIPSKELDKAGKSLVPA